MGGDNRRAPSQVVQVSHLRFRRHSKLETCATFNEPQRPGFKAPH